MEMLFKISIIQTSMNATHLDYPLNIYTWPTFVMRMPTVPTQKDRTTAAVRRATTEADESAQVHKY